MAEFLTIEQALGERRARPDRRHRRLAGWLILLGGLAVVAAMAATDPGVRCTEAQPCMPDRPGALLIGGFAVVPFLGWWQRRLAAATVVLLALALAWYDLVSARYTPPLWLYALVAAYGIGCVLLARDRGTPPPAGQKGRVPRRVPPPPRHPLRPPPKAALAATVVVAAALACAGWSSIRQAQVYRQQRAARIVTATVFSHPEWDVVELSFPGGVRERVTVLDAAYYPVGSSLRLAVDDRGLRQPLAERYDLSVFYTLAAMLGLIGVGLAWRFVDVALAQRRFFGRAQPVRRVRVRRGERRVYLYDGSLPVAELRVRDSIAPVAGHEPEPATLYGTPVPGEWCTVTLDSTTLSPRYPLRRFEGDARSAGTVSGRSASDGWPTPGWVELSLSIALIVGATIAGIALRERILSVLLAGVCGTGACDPVGMAAAGWAVIGVPLLAIAVIYLVARPGRPAFWGLIAAVAVLAGGLGVMLPGRGESAARAAAFLAEKPNLALFDPGFGAALAGLVVGGLLARSIRGKATPRLRGRRQPVPVPWLVVIGCDLAALIAALIWAAVAG